MPKQPIKPTPTKRKKHTTITIDSDLAKSFEEYQKQLGYPNFSSAVNAALRTFLLEGQFLTRSHIPSNAILVPMAIYQEIMDSTRHYLEQSIKKRETKIVEIDNTSFVVLSKREEERFLHRFSEVLPISMQVKNLTTLLERIAQKNGVKVFNPLIAFEKYREQDGFKEILLDQYAKILQFLEEEYQKQQSFFAGNSKEDIIALIEQELNDEKDIGEDLRGFIAFIVQFYHTKEW